MKKYIFVIFGVAVFMAGVLAYPVVSAFPVVAGDGVQTGPPPDPPPRGPCRPPKKC